MKMKTHELCLHAPAKAYRPLDCHGTVPALTDGICRNSWKPGVVAMLYKMGRLNWLALLIVAGCTDHSGLVDNSSHFSRVASFPDGDQTRDNPSISDIFASFDSHPVR